MKGYENFYEGGNYGTPTYSSVSPDSGRYIGIRADASTIGLATDVRTANQLKATSEKLSTGAKVIEVSAITPEVLESIPKQHFEELKRLKDITGAEFTFHGPIIEATGLTRDGWDEEKRLQAERQMLNAIEKGHDLDPQGNINVTIHTTAGLPEMKTRVYTKDGEKVTEMFLIDPHTGSTNVLKLRGNVLTGQKPDATKELNKLNEEAWHRSLANASFHAEQGRSGVSERILRVKKGMKEEGLSQVEINQIVKATKSPEGKKWLDSLSPETKKIADEVIFARSYGETYVKDAYQELQNLFNQAWNAAQRTKKEEDIKRLTDFKAGFQKKLDWYNSVEKLPDFADAIMEGISVLNTIQPPQTFMPLQDFAIDKASDTYSNIAFKTYKEFKDTSPILSLENPPAGGGLSRAEDMRELIEASRDKFVQKAQAELGMSESEAKKQAEKLIGATWDVGHINMLRKYGYDDKQLKKQAETIAPYVKHVHLSDNFGYEHTELPMGMGNVPTKEHLEAIQKYNKQVRKIVETGNWYQHFQTTPLVETFEAFGSPLYPMKMAPYWNQATGLMGGYFAGYGTTLPDQHFAMYGAGFSQLPSDLGGQAQGGRNRLSGAPME